MTDRQKYWITNPQGRHALVEGADQRDLWTRVRGWSESDGPKPTDQIYIQHPDGLTGSIPFEALEGGWSGIGWEAGPPPEPVDITKDPVLTDPQPAAPSPAPVEGAAEAPAKSQTPAAAGGAKSKE